MATNSTNINPEILKRTKGSLGSLISKPALTDKLLSKPPFRFLHDILTEVLRNTGFLRGLFTEEEMNSELVKDKEKKLALLQKVIDVLMFATGQKLKVKPTRIVAGAEPERTNEMLQLIAYCVQKKIDSSEAVRRVLKGEKPFSGQDKPEDKAKRPPVKPEQKEKDSKVNGVPKEGATSHNDELASKGSRSKLPERREGDKPKRSRSQDPSEDAERKKRGERARRERREHSEEDRGKRRESSEDHIKRREVSEEHLKRGSSRDSRRPPVPDQSPKRDLSPTPLPQPEQIDIPPDPQVPSPPAPRQRPASAKRSRRQDPEVPPEPTVPESGSFPPNNSHISMSEGDVMDPMTQTHAPTRADHGSSSENEPDMEYPPSMISRPPIRPSTARKAPPKRRENSQEGIDRIQSGSKEGPKVYLDTEDQDDIEQQFIVQEAEDVIRNGDTAEMLEEGQHGGLTKKLLETKKRLEGTDNETESDQGKVNEFQKHSQKEVTRKEVGHMQHSIQSICQNTAPLAKIIDYMHEDLEAMRNELSKWKKENEKYSKSLEKEEAMNEEIFKPYFEELDKLDVQIEETRVQVFASRGNYYRNQEKIDKLLESISFASQQ